MKIVVVGGGTAGWLAALMISKMYKEQHEVTLVESDSIGTIGVGEGSTGLLRTVLRNENWNFGCNEFDFMKKTKSTPKLGILFKEWTDLKEEYMEPLDFPVESGFFESEPLLSFLKSNDIDISVASIDGRFIKADISGFYEEENTVKGDYKNAHHFDAKLAAEYFESICGEDVSKISDTIEEIILDKKGSVESLVLSSKQVIKGDFFIDASGFSRIFAEKMGVKFIEYKELSLNSAIPFRIDHSYFDKPFFYTVAWAQKYGWMWMIPRTDSVGCGYIYDDRYINEEQAREEIEEKLGIKIEVIKNIKFTPGRLENAWNKNVLSIGLSSNFLEPLEATSIHGTISQLYNFIFLYLKDTLKDTNTVENQESYNSQTSRMIDNFRDVILFHYAGVRTDTPFWKKINKKALENKNISNMIKISKSRLLSVFDIDIVYGGAGATQFNWVLCALNHFSKETATREINKFNRYEIAKDNEKDTIDYISSKKWLTNEEFLFFMSRWGEGY